MVRPKVKNILYTNRTR